MITRSNETKIFYLVLLGIVIACVSLALSPKHVKGDLEVFVPPQQPDVITEGNVLVPNEAVAERLLAEWTIKQTQAKTSNNGNFCACVTFARKLTGFNDFFGPIGKEGWARYWPKNTPYPSVGGVVITNESYAGHVAVITKINPDSIEVVEANYSRCQKTTRTILLNSPVILGYWAQ